MGVHSGSDEGGLTGNTVRFTEELAARAEGGMVLVSPPVAEVLLGALEQLDKAQEGRRGGGGSFWGLCGGLCGGGGSGGNGGGGNGGSGAGGKASAKLVHMGQLRFPEAALFHTGQRAARAAAAARRAGEAMASGAGDAASALAAVVESQGDADHGVRVVLVLCCAGGERCFV